MTRGCLEPGIPRCKGCQKDSVARLFRLVSFSSNNFSWLIRHALTGYQFFFSNIRGVICFRNHLPGVFTAGEMRLRGVFTTVELWILSVLFLTGESRVIGDEFTGESTKITLHKLVPNTPASQDSPIMKTPWSRDSLRYQTSLIFFVCPFWCW
jgi:hypothetical protein